MLNNSRSLIACKSQLDPANIPSVQTSSNTANIILQTRYSIRVKVTSMSVEKANSSTNWDISVFVGKTLSMM